MQRLGLFWIALAIACGEAPAPDLPGDEPPGDTDKITDTDTGTPDPGHVCGEAVVDKGEECDDGAESETCDEDCTFVECGDETLNVTVGEECDPPDDDETCLSDCSSTLGLSDRLF